MRENIFVRGKKVPEQSIREGDWNTLIILDACRYDYFKEVIGNAQLEGELSRVDSKACNTRVWYRRFWSDDNDVILLAEHPRPFKEGISKNFRKSIPIWRDQDWLNLETVLKKCEEVIERNPEKRFLIHLVPPHLPYLGEKGSEFLEEYGVAGSSSPNVYDTVEKYGRKNGWDEPKNYYRENIREALEEIANNIDIFRAPIIITADHGELIGENDIYGHNNRGRLNKLLRQVPYLRVRRRKK